MMFRPMETFNQSANPPAQVPPQAQAQGYSPNQALSHLNEQLQLQIQAQDLRGVEPTITPQEKIRSSSICSSNGIASITLKNTFGGKKAKSVLPADYEPSNDTVILGRGACVDSPGNQQLRLLVQTHLRQYLDARDKLGKSEIVSHVVEIVRQRTSPRAAFVKFEKGHWVDVGERTSREKVGSMFRDCLGDKYKSSAKTKTAVREQKKRAKEQPVEQSSISPSTLLPSYQNYFNF